MSNSGWQTQKKRGRGRGKGFSKKKKNKKKYGQNKKTSGGNGTDGFVPPARTSSAPPTIEHGDLNSGQPKYFRSHMGGYGGYQGYSGGNRSYGYPQNYYGRGGGRGNHNPYVKVNQRYQGGGGRGGGHHYRGNQSGGSSGGRKKNILKIVDPTSGKNVLGGSRDNKEKKESQVKNPQKTILKKKEDIVKATSKNTVQKEVKKEIKEKNPVEEKPVEKKPVEKKPVAKKLVEKKPVEKKKKPVEKKLVEKKLVEKKPLKKTLVEKVEEKKVEEKKIEKKVEEKKKIEEKKVEEKVEEKKVEEKKVEEKKVEEKVEEKKEVVDEKKEVVEKKGDEAKDEEEEKVSKRIYSIDQLLIYKAVCTTPPPGLRTHDVYHNPSDTTARPKSPGYSKTKKYNRKGSQSYDYKKRRPKRHVASYKGKSYPKTPKHVSGANAWKPKKKAESAKENIESLIKGFLNLLSPNRYEEIKRDIMKIDIQDQLEGVVFLIFEMALMNEVFSNLFAQLCSDLSKSKTKYGQRDDKGKPLFKTYLLNKCQLEFQKIPKLKQEYENIDITKFSEEEILEKKNKIRKRMIGNIVFISELFKRKVLNEKIMHAIIKQLLIKKKDGSIPEEDEIEVLCNLLHSVGKLLDHEKAHPYMNFYFETLKSIGNRPNTKNRIRFMIQDLVDARAGKWKNTKSMEKAKTREEVQKEARKEKQEILKRSSGVSLHRSRPNPPRSRSYRTKKSKEISDDGEWHTMTKRKKYQKNPKQQRRKNDNSSHRTKNYNNKFSALGGEELQDEEEEEKQNKNKPVVLDEEAIKKAVKNLLGNLFEGGAPPEAVSDMDKLNLHDYSPFVDQMIEVILERKITQVKQVIEVIVLSERVKTKQLEKCFVGPVNKFMEEEIYFDAPMMFKFIGMIFGRLIVERLLSLKSVKEIISKLTLNSKQVGQVFVKIFKAVKESKKNFQKDFNKLNIFPSLDLTKAKPCDFFVKDLKKEDVFDFDASCCVFGRIISGDKSGEILAYIRTVPQSAPVLQKISQGIIVAIEILTRYGKKPDPQKEKKLFNEYTPALKANSKDKKAKMGFLSDIISLYEKYKFKNDVLVGVFTQLKENGVITKSVFTKFKVEQKHNKNMKNLESFYAKLNE